MKTPGKSNRSGTRAAPRRKTAGAAATKGAPASARQSKRERPDAAARIALLAETPADGVERNAPPLDEDRGAGATDIEHALGSETPDAAVKPRPGTSIE